MKVLAVSMKSLVIFTTLLAFLIILCIALVFGEDKVQRPITPEIEIVLPEGVAG